MERIGLIDFDGKIPNLALMNLSAYHKAQGDTVTLNPANAAQVDKVYCSVIFSKNREKAAQLARVFPNIEFGGTGWNLSKTLPEEIEAMKPDFDLYTVKDIAARIGGIMTREKKEEKARQIVNAGIGFTSRGCVGSCAFCVVPTKEGGIKGVGEIKDLINPRSKILILLDNNLTADPDCLAKLREVKERGLTVDITQGIDVRTMTPEIAKALAEVKHLRSIHYAWDVPGHEAAVMDGIKTLSRHIKKWKHLCFTLVGFNSTFEEDHYRFRKLTETGVDPFIMVYNQSTDARLKHFARWVNSRIYKVCPDFENYDPWKKERSGYFVGEQMNLFAA